jgi:hypothetical protein
MATHDRVMNYIQRAGTPVFVFQYRDTERISCTKYSGRNMADVDKVISQYTRGDDRIIPICIYDSVLCTPDELSDWLREDLDDVGVLI